MLYQFIDCMLAKHFKECDCNILLNPKQFLVSKNYALILKRNLDTKFILYLNSMWTFKHSNIFECPEVFFF